MSRGRILIIAMCAALALVVAGCGDSDDSTSTQSTDAAAAEQSGGDTNMNAKPEITVPDAPAPKQLETVDIVEGDGDEAKAGDQVTVQYVGVGYDSKEEFDSSWSRGEPATFGLDEVIAGWGEGIPGMKVGGRRELTIPANLAYGPTGSPPTIGPNEPLIFVVDLVAVN